MCVPVELLSGRSRTGNIISDIDKKFNEAPVSQATASYPAIVDLGWLSNTGRGELRLEGKCRASLQSG
jgi:hypothetical protein